MLEGRSGYVVAEPDEANARVIWRKPWRVRSFVQVGPKLWSPKGPWIAHKTPVKIVRALISHKGWGTYEGVFEVELVDGTHAHIDLRAFSIRPYWLCPLRPKAKEWGTGLWDTWNGTVIGTVAKTAKPVTVDGAWTTVKPNEHVACRAHAETGKHIQADVVICKVLDRNDHWRESVELPIGDLTIVK